MTLSEKRNQDIVSAFAAAIADLVLDAAEDAAADATDDMLAGGEQLIETTLDDEEDSEDDTEADLPDENALADIIMNRVLEMMQARRNLAQDWTTMRDMFPRYQHF